MLNNECDYQITLIEGDVIDVTLSGTVDLDCSKSYVRKLTRSIDGFKGQPFKVLFDLTCWEGSTPEVFEHVSEFGQWVNKQSVVAKALVSSSKFKVDMATTFNQTLLQGNCKVFDNKDDALSWLRNA